MPNNNDPKAVERQNLLGDLESIQRLLHEEMSNNDVAPASEKIPILLDAVTTVPVLKEVVEDVVAQSVSPKSNQQEQITSASTLAPRPITNATEAQLSAEGEQLIDNLLEEYLPMIESRLREQLRLRLNFIIKEQMRKYR